jgi:hypothetical protein
MKYISTKGLGGSHVRLHTSSIIFKSNIESKEFNWKKEKRKKKSILGKIIIVF